MSKSATDGASWREILAPDYAASLALVCLGVWLHAADELIIATMMPAMVADIGGASLISWTFALYELGSVVAGAVSALLALRFGVRLPMALAAFTFAAGCVVAASAMQMWVVVVGRLFQGLGGGGLVALSFIAIGLLFPKRLMARAMAAVSVLWGVSAFLGPLIGGLFVEFGIWRGGFWFFGAQAVLLAVWVIASLRSEPAGSVPKSAPIGNRTIPALRLATLSAGVVLIALAGTNASPFGIAALVLGGVAFLALFLWLDARAGESRLLPRNPMSLRHSTGAGLTMVLLFSAATIAVSIYGPLLITLLHGVSALVAGYVIACAAIGWSVVAVLVSGAPERHDPKLIMTGMLLVTASIPGFIYSIPNGPVWLIAVFAAMEGGGFGMAWTFILRRATALAADDEIERVSGAIPTIQRVGYAIGAASIGIIANRSGFAEGATRAFASNVSTAVFLACLPIAGFGLIAAFRFVRR